MFCIFVHFLTYYKSFETVACIGFQTIGILNTLAVGSATDIVQYTFLV